MLSSFIYRFSLVLSFYHLQPCLAQALRQIVSLLSHRLIHPCFSFSRRSCVPLLSLISTYTLPDIDTCQSSFIFFHKGYLHSKKDVIAMPLTMENYPDSLKKILINLSEKRQLK